MSKPIAVSVFVVSPDTRSERRFDLHITVEQLKVPIDISVGARCEVETDEPGFHKRGTVRFVGPTKFAKTGIWVGIEYDEPIGKNDGSVQGERYFTCQQNFGVFIRPDRVKVGDYPVEEINFDDEEM
ncbi:Tubulin-folding cofactor B [Grifola frondosa]|uniref:Tubulin-folding cofactor B n=1 Tax=Grifola frondosa TaxID=5627 RepID=A0A1C7MBI4_GRIFR|nr:Tubulin-folding cofactor B [Grifola frondosa]